MYSLPIKILLFPAPSAPAREVRDVPVQMWEGAPRPTSGAGWRGLQRARGKAHRRRATWGRHRHPRRLASLSAPWLEWALLPAPGALARLPSWVLRYACGAEPLSPFAASRSMLPGMLRTVSSLLPPWPTKLHFPEGFWESAFSPSGAWPFVGGGDKCLKGLGQLVGC